jgi:hypothetical protein
VFDSVEEDEYIETINKLGANVRCIDAAEGECLSRCRCKVHHSYLSPQSTTPRWLEPSRILVIYVIVVFA